MIGYGKDDKSFGIALMPERRKPCLCIQMGNVITKVASFNDYYSAKIFIDFMAELFGMEKVDWNSDDIPVGFRTDDWGICDENAT